MIDLDMIEKMLAVATAAPWEAQRLDASTHEEMIKYLDGTIRMGGARYFMVGGKHDDGGPADVCHTGNGKRSEANAHAIAAILNAAPELLRLARLAPACAEGEGRACGASETPTPESK